MKLALIADIHGNLSAFDAVLAAIAAERPEQIVCLGDVAATGPQPREVIARLRDLACPVVMGNADAELLAPASTSAHDAPDETMRKILEISRWAADQLDAADRAYLASFQPTVSIDLGEARLLCCHGSARSFDDVILATTPDDALDPMMAVTGAAVQVQAGGHTHFRMLRTWRDREIVNPGSVGLAYQHRPDGGVRIPPWAEFAILSSEGGTLSVDFRRILYDREATVRAMHEQEMPHAAWWSRSWQ